MNKLATLVLLALGLAVADATIHTMCFNYFLNKDKCVNGAAGQNIRCNADPKPHEAPVAKFVMQTPPPKQAHNGGKNRLERRYDTYHKVLEMSSGQGICGTYDSDRQDGVCLWSGPEQDNPTVHTAGWLNGIKKSNCGKQVYIQRKDKSKGPFYVPVLDGCSFETKKLEEGCFEIGVTKSLAAKLTIFPNETSGPDSGYLYGGFTWDFNNLDGSNSAAGPV
ncbi:hypothetical protein PGT21_007036 [Puccinia graminis f. sp. tritici]|uniref:Secreted protein n=2 Tax=Puccinia graminis f. sp. tritici TaxID=56615 RepID=E3JXU0_PUCGT|nr:uncharacterized protein PGTG_02326 [Puccinia graminis f. sp. tritici CRL 75-36-700-3]EFP76865.2 hypothetical protein PGTG_02326 [Puccinia graminis f. sp. tritici CRL 75-36-700-3]KAA1118819.1 hypothetical protein PGT21_007036 [Puccinia graminis f. sp. tritici]